MLVAQRIEKIMRDFLWCGANGFIIDRLIEHQLLLLEMGLMGYD